MGEYLLLWELSSGAIRPVKPASIPISGSTSLAARGRRERGQEKWESHRHKDSYRSGNVEEEREEACSFSLFSLSLSFFAPSRARVGVPFQDLRRFNRAINLTPCCNNTSRRNGAVRQGKISSALRRKKSGLLQSIAVGIARSVKEHEV